MPLRRMDHSAIVINKLGKLGALFQLCYLAGRNREFRKLGFLKLKMRKLLTVVDGLGISYDAWVNFADKEGKIVKLTITSEKQPEGCERFRGIIEVSFVVQNLDGKEIVESGAVSVSLLNNEANEADDIPQTVTQGLRPTETLSLTSESETKDILRQFGIPAV